MNDAGPIQRKRKCTARTSPKRSRHAQVATPLIPFHGHTSPHAHEVECLRIVDLGKDKDNSFPSLSFIAGRLLRDSCGQANKRNKEGSCLCHFLFYAFSDIEIFVSPRMRRENVRLVLALLATLARCVSERYL